MRNKHQKITADDYNKKSYPIVGKKIFEIQVGDVVTYGKYAQDANGKIETPLEWLVLDKCDCKVLLISKYGLTAKKYSEQYPRVTWQTCTL